MQQNRVNRGLEVPPEQRITAEGKRVMILGGGDTGADCLGTAHRQGAEMVVQWEILPEPPASRSKNNPWPLWPLILRSSAAHEEGGVRGLLHPHEASYRAATVVSSGSTQPASNGVCRIRRAGPR